LLATQTGRFAQLAEATSEERNAIRLRFGHKHPAKLSQKEYRICG
jgi:hypothetical protein